MKINNWLNSASKILDDSSVPTARLDCTILIEDLIGKDRSYFLAHPEIELSIKDIEVLDRQVRRRAKHEPLAYIRGKSEFYGREFIVNPHTLEPRPETETIIEFAKKLVKTHEKLVMADIGAGSGCIAISVKLEIPKSEVIASDIDTKCLETARRNSKKLGADIEFLNGSLLEPFIDRQIDVILCNLPYVPDRYKINEAAKFEPKHAIFGGHDGLELYRELFKQLVARSNKPEYVLTESLPFQHEKLAVIANKSGYQLKKTDDFIQLFKLKNEVKPPASLQ